MTQQTVPEVEFNTFDDAFTSDPYPTYARLREAGRVLFAQPGFWLVPHYQDVMGLLRHPHVSSDPMKSELFSMIFQ